MLAPSSICRVALLLGALAVAGAAPAPTGLSGARALYRQGRLSEALAAFEAALAAGGHAPTDLASIYLHLGILRAGSEDRAGSEAAFRALCALDPGAALPPGSSPTIAEPFARACSATPPPARTEAPEIGPADGLPTLADLAPPDLAPPRSRTSTTPAPAIVAGDPRAGTGDSEATPADATETGTSPWLWIAIGLAAAAAGTAGAIVLAGSDDRFAHVGSIRIEGP